MKSGIGGMLVLGFVAVCLAGGRPAVAQDPEATILEPIVVTATKVSQPYGVVSSRVTIIDGDELRARGVRFLAEALAGLGGAEVVRAGSFGAVSSLFLRGGESDYVKVLIDGVPANQPGGSFDFSGLSTENVERIEIVQGPASVLYGSDAISGVIQVFTRGGSVGTSGNLSLEAGTFGARSASASIRGGSRDAGYSFSVADYRSDGIYTRDGAGAAFNNDYRNTALIGRVELAPGSSTTAAVTAHYRDGEYHFPTNSAGNFVDVNSFTGEQVLTLGLDVRHSLSRQLTVSLLGTLNRHDGVFDDSQDDTADTLGFFEFISRDLIDRRGADLRFDFEPAPGTVLSIGGGGEWQGIESVSNANSQFGPSTDGSDHTRRNQALYAQALTGLGSMVFLNAGVRLDHNDNFGTHVTYRAGVVVTPVAGNRLRASVGTGFKEPTFFENFATGFATGNPHLEPEESFSVEGGVEQDLLGSRLSLGVTYYYQEFTNLVQYTFAPPNPGDPNYFNVGAARSSGVEMTVKATPVPGLSLTGDLSLLRTRVIDPGFQVGDPNATFAAGQRLLRRPATEFSLRVEYAAGQTAGASLGLRHTGNRIDRDFAVFPASRIALAPHTLVDLAVRFRVSPAGPLTVTLKAENLTDVEYLSAVGFPAPGRSLLAGVMLGF